jgi:protein-L-isoaspartate(D-aspartate) O-methyltransferase
MRGWVVPPPKKPTKSRGEFLKERREKVARLIEEGLLRSQPIIEAMLKVPREDFIPEMYRDYAYMEVPLPLNDATISCPHSYPLFYEALELGEGDEFLEIGSGSGYGAALAWEIVGGRGKVVTIDIDEEIHEFAKGNLRRMGYQDVICVLGDGSVGYPPEAPYDKICVTAACPDIPPLLVEQLKMGGNAIAPVGWIDIPQDLILLKKREKEIRQYLRTPGRSLMRRRG